jgi:pimeloyl-ACP methyl ester carboxylesterase
MSQLETETYLTLRANRSPREADTISQVKVNRYFYDLVLNKQSPDFVPIESLPEDEAHGLVRLAFEAELKAPHDKAQDELLAFFKEEHIDMLAKIPGWLRTRVFSTSSLDSAAQDSKKLLLLHDFAKDNDLGGDAYKAATSSPRRAQVAHDYVASASQRKDTLFYVFGPAPRDLDSLSRLPAAAAFTSADGKTITTPGPDPVLSSYVTMSDGLEIPYRLEGNPSPNAPVVAFCNSLLTSLHMWDPLITHIKKNRPDLKLLRYDVRGRHAIPQPSVAATLETVTSDLVALLDALRIPKLHALIGVSMGGATTLNFALTQPDRVGRFIACDFNAASSPSNTAAWKDRIALAEEDNGKGMEKLASATVGRWFSASTLESNVETSDWMTQMVRANNVDGFKHSCTALWDYDMKPRLSGCRVPALLAVGEEDGKGALVKAMQGFGGSVGEGGAELKIVEGTGHLPMCEKPAAFWDAIKEFL